MPFSRLLLLLLVGWLYLTTHGTCPPMGKSNKNTTTTTMDV
jgi:hypothetical protein